ncbi:hypothetical protein BC628DRAFT_1047932 [Trametes gibbosa]|nr:hypothetical protein BC628DRAFT_1047932 [Trametes gibbosa]
MGLLKMMKATLSPPSAPKHLPVPLPELAADSPPGQTWSSSGSSSCSSPSPTTPSPRWSPIAYRAPSKLSGGRAGTPSDVNDISRFSSPDPAMEKSRMRRAPTPAVEILKPTPRRAYIPAPPSTTVMQVALPPMADPHKPLKGILKSPRRTSPISPTDLTGVCERSLCHVPLAATATPSSPTSSASSPPPQVYRPASSASGRPRHEGPLELHWQLLPPNQRPWMSHPSKVLYYDITKPPVTIRIRDFSERPPRVSRASEVKAYLEKGACKLHLPSMTIRYEKIPGLEIRIAAKDGNSVRCQDVFDGIYQFFDRVMTPDERCEYIPTEGQLKRVEDAFLQRCKDSHRAVPQAEQDKGIRFVDLLEGNTAFRGLMRPTNERRSPDKYWVVEFGPCQLQ